ncbi:MAG: hypothetical protein HOK83_09885 [Rhodospirillaceae bacterium]|jgi:hypothetical protein|nr:hypothetical protein [Rhodospirillaceae bacterium]
MVAALIGLQACSMPAVDYDDASYDHASYALDLSMCNMNDAVVNTFEGGVTVLENTGLGFIYGAGVTANNHRHGHYYGDGYTALGVLVVGGAIGAPFGAGHGVYEAIDEIELSTRECMAQQGYVVASSGG